MPVAGGTGGGYTGALTRGLAESFSGKIKKSAPVTRIDHDGEIVTVYASNGEGTFSNYIFLHLR